MKRITVLTLCWLAISAVHAQAPKPPVISDAVQKKFFKLQSELVQAQNRAAQAQQESLQKQKDYQAAIDELNSICGKEFQVQLDKDGFPGCVAKPEAKK